MEMKLNCYVILFYLLQICNGQNNQEQVIAQQPALQPQPLPQPQQTVPLQQPGSPGQPNSLMDLYRGAATSLSQALINLLNYKIQWISRMAANIPVGSAGNPGSNLAVPGSQAGVNILAAPLVSSQSYQQPLPPQNTPQQFAPALPLVTPQAYQQVAPQQTGSAPPLTQPLLAQPQPNPQTYQQVAPQQTGFAPPSNQPVLSQPNPQASQQLNAQPAGPITPPASATPISEHLANYQTGLATGGLDSY